MIEKKIYQYESVYAAQSARKLAGPVVFCVIVFSSATGTFFIRETVNGCVIGGGTDKPKCYFFLEKNRSTK